MVLKRKKLSLADKINSLLSVAPTNFSSDEEAEETKAKVIEHDEESEHSNEDLPPSKIRRQNVTLLHQVDKRYEGKKVSRRDIYNEDSANDLVHSSTDDERSDKVGNQSDDENNLNNKSEEFSDSANDENDIGNNEDSVEYSENSDDELDSADSSDNAEYGSDGNYSPEEEKETDASFKTMSNLNVRGDIEKGNCVRSQLKLWENFLEVRIKLQKCLTVSNQMPQYDTYKDFKSKLDFVKKTNETKSILTNLLDKMLVLQNTLLKQYPETKDLQTRKGTGMKPNTKEHINEVPENSMEEEICSDTEDEVEDEEIESDIHNEEKSDDETKERGNKQRTGKKTKLSEYEKILKDRHNLYTEYRNSVIQKWNDKTRVAAGRLTKAPSQSALKQIEFVLNDKEKLRKRSQLKRSEYDILGKQLVHENDGRRTQEYDTEIYDDDDFYHQLLRDLIEYKSADVTDPIQLSKQWIQLQNMRSKMKRKIDTRATKGRRVRYDVHNKLVNFMAPITIYDTWTETAKNELYNSLFDKIKPVQEQVEYQS